MYVASLADIVTAGIPFSLYIALSYYTYLSFPLLLSFFSTTLTPFFVAAFFNSLANYATTGSFSICPP
jgi:hypothetical protein